MVKGNTLTLIGALDIGKSTTKAIFKVLDEDRKELNKDIKHEHKRKSFATRCDKLDEDENIDSIDADSFLVEYNGARYIVGEQAKTSSDGSSKLNYIHEICGLVAITRYLEEGMIGNVNFILATPLNQLSSKDHVSAYKGFFTTDKKPKTIIVNDKEYKFFTQNIISRAEGSGIVIKQPDKFKDYTLLVDLGGMNLGYSVYKNGKAIRDTRDIDEVGNNRLEKIISKYISKNDTSAALASKTKIERAIRNGYLKVNGEKDLKSVEYIKKAKDVYIKEVLGALSKNSIDISEYDNVLFIGGTTQNVKDSISEYIKHADFTVNSQWDAVEGLYSVALTKFK